MHLKTTNVTKTAGSSLAGGDVKKEKKRKKRENRAIRLSMFTCCFCFDFSSHAFFFSMLMEQKSIVRDDYIKLEDDDWSVLFCSLTSDWF